MDTKRLRYLQLFAELSKIDSMDASNLRQKIEPILDLDFGYALEVWEYMTQLYEETLSVNTALAEFFGNQMLEMFYQNSQQKTLKAIREIPHISKFVFLYNPLADRDLAQVIVAEWLMTNKYDFADFAFGLLQKNRHIEYNKYMSVMVSYCLGEIIDRCKQEGTRIAMPKKLSELLLKGVSKIKGPDKALLQQRIKEVN